MRYYSNTAVATTLENSGGITPTSTQIILGSNSGYPTQFPFTLRLDPDTPNEEIVTVNSGGGTVGSPYVVSRGADATTARTHAQYSVVTHGFSARDLKEPQDHIADTNAHARRPLYTFQVNNPTFTPINTWVAFPSSAWPAITFVAPSSGLVMVTLTCNMQMDASLTLIALSFRMTGGKTLFSSLDSALVTEDQNRLSASKQYLVTGITPGASTTVTPYWFISNGTSTNGDMTGGQLIVDLLP